MRKNGDLVAHLRVEKMHSKTGTLRPSYFIDLLPFMKLVQQIVNKRENSEKSARKKPFRRRAYIRITMVGRAGFEPAKSKDNRFTVCPV